LSVPLRFSDFASTVVSLLKGDTSCEPPPPRESILKPSRIRIEQGAAVSDDVRVPLTPCEEKILAVLNDAYPHAASAEALESAFTRHGGNSVRVYITYLRKKLAALPAFREMGCPEELFTLAQTGLRPICGARFTRIAKTVAVNGSILEIAMDSGVLTGGNRQIPLTELEVELKSGREEDCLAFARELAATFGLEAEPYSKFRRALDLYKGETNGL
jgi:hypothetical protein